jgi:sugar phosphate isomerase/epimerase
MLDREVLEPGALGVREHRLAWGKGDTPIREILQLVKKNKWTMPATIELEYEVPAGSDAVKEVTKCLDYCKQALA